jgi:hypothetical protein
MDIQYPARMFDIFMSNYVHFIMQELSIFVLHSLSLCAEICEVTKKLQKSKTLIRAWNDNQCHLKIS